MRRYDYVDLLRGLAAMAVLVTHYQWFYAPSANIVVPKSPLPLEQALWPLYLYGGLAVQEFWVLSGFVFAVAYPKVSVREFTVHRVARLYPLHLLTLLIVVVLQGISLRLYGGWQVYGHNDAAHFFPHLLMASNWFSRTESFNAPIWSVSVEILVYFLFLAYLIRPKLWLAIALAITGLGLQEFTHWPVAQCMFLFFTGVGICLITQRYNGPLLGLPLVGVLLFGGILGLVGLQTEIPRLALYLGAPSLLMAFVALDHRFGFPNGLKWIGLSTYSIYLLHMPLLIFARLFGGWYIPLLPSPWFLGAWIGTVALLSVWSYRHIEAPAQRYLRRVLMPRQSALRCQDYLQ